MNFYYEERRVTLMQPTLNPQVLHELQAIRLDDGNNLACQLVTIFLDVTPALIDELHAACASGDATTAARLISRLRGSSSCIGALHFADLCAELERLEPTNRSTVSQRIGRVRDEYARLEYALAEYVEPRFAYAYGS